jgi:hypothetical protein
MIDYKNVLKIPYINFKFLLIIILLSIITILGYTFSFIALIFTIILTVGLIGTNILSQLQNYNFKTIIKILELSLVYSIVSIIYFFIQAIVFLIFAIPIYFLRNFINTNIAFNFNFGLFFLILLIILGIIVFIIIEYLKNIGFIRYLNSSKFENFFEIKNNLKYIFTKDFLTSQIFLLGYIIVLIIIFVILLSLLTLIFPSLTNYFVGIFIMLFVYLLISSIIVITNLIVKNK